MAGMNSALTKVDSAGLKRMKCHNNYFGSSSQSWGLNLDELLLKSEISILKQISAALRTWPQPMVALIILSAFFLPVKITVFKLDFPHNSMK